MWVVSLYNCLATISLSAVWRFHCRFQRASSSPSLHSARRIPRSLASSGLAAPELEKDVPPLLVVMVEGSIQQHSRGPSALLMRVSRTDFPPEP